MANRISRVYDGYVTSQETVYAYSNYDPKGIVNAATLLLKGSTALFGVTIDNSGNIFVADSTQHVILKAEPNGDLAWYAGLAGTSGNNLANVVTLANARFNTPRGLACDAYGNLYVADSGNNQIRKITPDGRVSLLAGDPNGLAGYVNGTSAKFKNPWDLAIDSSNNIFVADTDNHTIRKFLNGTQTVITLAGAKAAGDITGAGNLARFNTPISIAVDAAGVLFVADSLNYKVKKVDRDGNVSRVCGAGTKGTTVGTYLTTQFQDMLQITVDRSANIYVLDTSPEWGPRLMKINNNGICHTVYDFDQAPTPGYPSVIGVEVDRSGKFVIIESDAAGAFSSSSSSSSSSSIDSHSSASSTSVDSFSSESSSSSSSTSIDSHSSASSASSDSSSSSSIDSRSSYSSESSNSDSSESSSSSSSDSTGL